MEDLPKGGTSYLLVQCTSSTSTVKHQKGLVAAASNIA